MTTRRTPSGRTEKVLDPASLRALAHPLRVRMLGMLRSDGPATATSLAARTGESSGTTSWHLRQLHGAGFVVEAEGLGNGRERWWAAAQEGTRLELDDSYDDDATRASVSAYLEAVQSGYAARAAEWVRTQHDWPRAWQRVAGLSDWRLSLGPDDLGRLMDEVEALVERYRRDPRPGDEAVSFQVQGFPVERAR